MSTNDDDSQSPSSEETIDQDVSPEINKGKRKAEKPIDPKLYGTWEDGKFFDFIQTNKVKNDTNTRSTSNPTPEPVISRKDNNHKYLIVQNSTYLDLSHVPFKDQPQAIDDLAQSLSIIITNYKNSWSKEKFLDYIATPLQGDVL